MNPYLKLAIRVSAAGLLALAVSLQGNLPGVSADDLVQAVIAGVIAAITFSGIELGTPVNSSIGAFKS